MHRFFLPPEQCQGSSLVLTGAEGHHALDVLRIKSGEKVAVLDGAGREFLCVVRTLERKRATLAVEETFSSPPPSFHITLVQAIPKGKIFESILQKATELGAFRIVPLLSERVVIQLDEEANRQKTVKWQQVTVEAIKQCGQRWLPRVEPAVKLTALLNRAERFDLSLVGALHGDARHPREYFDSFLAHHKTKPVSVCLWIGPEGDFTADELKSIQGSGARPTSLGPLVLRSETAATYVLSVVNYELQSPEFTRQR